METPTGFVYIWYDKKRKWFCIGSHLGHENDGYVTSTGFMKKAYKKRPEDFKRRILEYYYGCCHKKLREIEQKWLDMINENELFTNNANSETNIRYYNMKKQASGLSGKVASVLKKQWWDSEEGAKQKIKQSDNMNHLIETNKGRTPWNKGKKCPQISKSRRETPTVYTPDMRKRRSETTKELWKDPDYREKMGNRNKPKTNGCLGKKHKQETKNKISDALTGKEKTNEHKIALSVSAKERSQKIVTCPHCSISGNGPVMNRWHFSNCKLS